MSGKGYVFYGYVGFFRKPKFRGGVIAHSPDIGKSSANNESEQ